MDPGTPHDSPFFFVCQYFIIFQEFHITTRYPGVSTDGAEPLRPWGGEVVVLVVFGPAAG